MYFQFADRHLEATLPHLRPRWWPPLDPLVARHEGGGATHVRAWVLAMQHVAAWPVETPAGCPSYEKDNRRWEQAVIRFGLAGEEPKQCVMMTDIHAAVCFI